MKFKVKGWSEFQHYKDRNPPWIKLHNQLLDNYEFEMLDDATKGHLLCIWMLASRTNNKMVFDNKWVGRKIGASSTVNLKTLVDAGFIELLNEEHDASTMLQESKVSVPSEEESRVETEKRKEDLIDSLSEQVIQVINHLNITTGSKYKSSTKSHAENIRARLSDYTVEDLMAVINHKFSEWGNDPKMSSYIRPQTLFQTGKFDGYLRAARSSNKSGIAINTSQITYESGDM